MRPSMGGEREDEMLAQLTKKAGVPVFTATRSVIDALELMQAKRLALVSPYPDSLQQASDRYWVGRGYDLVRSCSAYRDTSAFHAIYSLSGDDAQASLDSVRDAEFDAAVMLGTGMPTLGPILDTPTIGTAPVLSCMYCLAWRAIAYMGGVPPKIDSLFQFAKSDVFASRLHALRSA